MFHVLKGIDSQEVKTTHFVTDLLLEVDLFVVDAKCMNTPFIIGADIQNRKGIPYVRTRDYRNIIRDSSCVYEPVLVFEANDQWLFNTVLIGVDLNRLMNKLVHL